MRTIEKVSDILEFCDEFEDDCHMCIQHPIYETPITLSIKVFDIGNDKKQYRVFINEYETGYENTYKMAIIRLKIEITRLFEEVTNEFKKRLE